MDKFRLSFQGRVVPVGIAPQRVYAPIDRALSIVNQTRPPSPRSECEDCKRFAQMLQLLG